MKSLRSSGVTARQSNEVLRRGLLSYGVAAVMLGSGARVVLGCSKESTTPPDRAKILVDLAENVLVPAYTDAAAAAALLESAVTALRDAPSPATLAAARDAWRRARSSWKQTDAFLFGPANDIALVGGAIDTPSDFAKIEATSAAETALDASVVASLGANLRGLPGVEALLFDPAKEDAALLAGLQERSARRARLVALLSADLRAKIVAVRDAWTGGYAVELTTAGRGSTVFAAERQAVDAVVNGLIAGAEVLTALRLAKPLGLDRSPPTPNAALLESTRSDATIDDILAVLDGIEAVYRGRRGGKAGLPLSDAVAERTPTGDAQFKELLEKAKAAVRSIPGPLRTAVVERQGPVVAAYAAVREVKRSLAADIAGALGTSVGFNVTDGD